MIMMKMQVMMIINITYMIIDDNLEDDHDAGEDDPDDDLHDNA